MLRVVSLVPFIAALLLCGRTLATEYFVSPRGSDKDSGTTRAQALQTIARGVSLLKPGDTLTVGPGVYPESVRCALEGRPDAPITIRAARPGTACIEGFVSVGRFERMPGMHYTYRTQATVPEKAIVMERGTGRRLRACPDPGAMEQVLGSYCVDQASGALYVHSSDSNDPNAHDIQVSVREEGLMFEKPWHGKITPRHLIIEGLEIRGFSGVNRGFGGHGLAFQGAEDVVVRNCTVHDCDHGIWFRWGAKRVKLLNNTIYRCWSSYLESGNIKIERDARDCLVAGNRIHDTETHGLRTYSGGGPGTVFEKNIVWNCQNSAIQFKGGRLGTARHNVCSGYSSYLGSEHHNTVFGEPGDRYMHDPTDLFYGDFRSARCIRDPKFVDPLNWDFRLQSDSPARGRGPDGTDLGAYPYQDEVFFVSPHGDDGAVGTSVATAWKTVARAADAAKPGTTVLLTEGTYAEPLVPARSGTKDAPIVFRRRGRDRMCLTGGGKRPFGIDLRDRAHIRVEGLEVTGFSTAGIAAGGKVSEGIEIVRCVSHDCIGDGIVLADAAAEVEQCTAARNGKFGLRIGGMSSAVSVVSCVFATNTAGQISVASASPGRFCSEHNNLWSASGPLAFWNGEPMDGLGEWRRASGQDYLSQPCNPLFAAADDGDFRLQGNSPCLSKGAAWCDQGGAGRIRREPVLAIARLESSGITSTTATVSWWTERHEGNTQLEWGPSPELGNVVSRKFEHGLFHHVTLTGLEPNTTYFYRASTQTPGWLMHGNPVLWQVELDKKRQTASSPVLKLRTVDRDPAPRTYHVSLKGTDENDGLSRAKAFRHIGRAASLALPGDTVLIEPGNYAETIMPLHSGRKGRPITFKPAGPEPVVIDGRLLQPIMVALLGKSYITIEGFHFKGQKYHQYHGYCDGAAWCGQVWLDQADHIVVRRCFFDGRGSYVQHGIDSAMHVEGQPLSSLRVEDCAFLGLAKVGYLWQVDCEFDHCVFGMCFFGHAKGEGASRFSFRNCVVTSALARKSRDFGWMIWTAGDAKSVRSDHNAFWYQPYDVRRWVGILEGQPGFVPDYENAKCYLGEEGLEHWRADTGNDQRSLTVADPRFVTYKGSIGWQGEKEMTECENPEAPRKIRWLDDFRLEPDSPLKGKGENGADIGIRFSVPKE